MNIRRGMLRLEQNGLWTALVRVNGRTYSRSTGTCVRADAEASLRRLVVIADCACKQTLESAALLRAWPRYEASAVAERLAQRSRQVKYRAWLHFSVWIHEVHPEVSEPRDVTHAIAEEYHAFFQGGHAPITCALRIAFLREIFRVVLASYGCEAKNPWDGIRAKSGPVCVRRELTLDEVSRLLAAADDCGWEWRMLFSLAIYTGMRLGDCCRLGWESVDLASSVIQIVPHKTRRYFAGHPVVIPLHPELAALLGETRPENRIGFVMGTIARDFVSRRWAVSRNLEDIFRKSNIKMNVRIEGRERLAPLATFHSLRHTFVSIAVNAGVPLATVQSVVGHSSTAMTRHYYHPSMEALRQAVNAIPAIGRKGSAPQVVSPRPVCDRSTLCGRLRELEKARKLGLVSEEEFSALRRSILSNV